MKELKKEKNKSSFENGVVLFLALSLPIAFIIIIAGLIILNLEK